METMTAAQMAQLIKQLTREQGFARCGVARAEKAARADYVREWLDRGFAGSMAYLHRYFDQRVDPRRLLPGARSVVMVALPYRQPEPPPSSPDDRPVGRVAMYAWGEDYHRVVKEKLFAVVDQLRANLAEPFEAKVCVDTAPLLERELAAAAGIGWIGKNTLVLNRHLGSYFFLGGIVTTLNIEPDQPAVDHCGSCRACLDACPTQAFPQPYRMNASVCISYLTIERREPVPAELHTPIGDWIFGCDVCQQVCPFNREAPMTDEPRFLAQRSGPTLDPSEVLNWTQADYRKNLSGSAVKRAKPDMLKRNAAVVLANRLKSKKLREASE